jgi:tripartite-type tricarboxylate transporter receptor subunit TctC
LKTIAGLGLAASACGKVFADAYPSQVVRIIVPSAPGGGNDTIARVLSQQLQQAWKQSVIVEYRDGADGTIGAASVAKSAPDGYTLMLCTNGVLTINPPLYPNLPYDPLKDFSPITVCNIAPLLLVIHPSLPINSVADLVAYAKEHPNELSFSSSGVGSVTHLAGAMFNSMAAVQTRHIPYRGSGPAMTDLLSGRVPMRFSAAAALLPLVKSGQLRALAVTSADKYELTPDLAPVSATIPGYSVNIWYGLVGPAGMPESLVNTIQTESAKQLKTSDVTAKLTADGSQAVGNTPAQFAQMMKTETAQWSTIIRENNIHLE